MGKGQRRAVEKGVFGKGGSIVSKSSSLCVPPAPVYYPTEEEFKDPLEFIDKIRWEAEAYGACKIVPPKSWKPPFALDLDQFTFPTKTQAIHQLQVRSAPCDSKTFSLEYCRFLEEHCGRKPKKRVVYEGGELDFCRLFNAVKRFGGYDKVVKNKKWGEVFRFVQPAGKASECAKHVLCQLYLEHLYDYEMYYNRMNKEREKSCRREMLGKRMSGQRFEILSSKRRRKDHTDERIGVFADEDEEHDQICEQCQSGLHGGVMLLCDRCNKGWHIYCLSPPLKRVPPGNWYCLECLNSEKDSFGFVPSKPFSLDSFRSVADRAKKKWLGSATASRVQLEKKFWEIVEGSVGEVEVMYGSDLDTSVYGSGFPRLHDQIPSSLEAEVWNEYCASPWNLNNLPKLQGSMLREVHQSIAGVMVPWLYIGMLFSSFCWHFEDHCFYSMNYLHWGEAKCWYSVPGSKSCAFEKVMRKSLPDLFDAQPDLLFQLVTMLNPSILQQNGVPVYSVLQEPGNFVITFPRSYHSGFNFGFNCAEAVNFAPADWLPHGGFGAGLYQLYRKAAILSHEELLCVAAKNDVDKKVAPYLKRELLRIYDKERIWREQLWRIGIINFSPMLLRKHPEYVGTDEDPTCIICQQFLYLSAIVCSCRPSAFVCLEHWEHLCECKPDNHRLLYRHTLAELTGLVLSIDAPCFEEDQVRNMQIQLPSSKETVACTKKVKGAWTLAQVAEEWIQRSCNILETAYCRDAYISALKEAEQFLWAGYEMDPVRDMVKNLTEAQTWAEGVKDCLAKVDSWLCHRACDFKKVEMENVSKLLNCDPVPCNEIGLHRLKFYEQEARILIQEINSSLSVCSNVLIADLEILYSKVCDFPIYVKESENLLAKISSKKVWIDSVRKCIFEKSPATVEVDALYVLKSKSSELGLQLPEVGMLLNLLRQVESCQSRCSEMLKGPMSMENVEVLLCDFDGFTVKVPELELLRQYYCDAVSWLSRFSEVLTNAHNKDLEIVVSELSCIQKGGASLRIKVDELHHAEFELKKACCRVKALKAQQCKMPLDFIQQLMLEASALQIEKEEEFLGICSVLSIAICWEDRAKHILASEAQMSDFEDVLRASEDIYAVLPSLNDIKNALSSAKSWLEKSKPFLVSELSWPSASSSLQCVNALKDLVLESKSLKISLEERSVLEMLLEKCSQWELDACSTLNDAESILKLTNSSVEIASGLTLKIEHQVAALELILSAGLSLGVNFAIISRLQDACSTLQCCLKALSFCSITPSLEEVEKLIEVAEHLSLTYASNCMCYLLIDGLDWLKKAMEISASCNRASFKFSEAKEVLGQIQRIAIPFPLVVGEIVTSIQKHENWVEQVHLFFRLESGSRQWAMLLQLKELGSTDAFNCSELDMILSEVRKVEQWKQHCRDIVGHSSTCTNSLVHVLLEIKSTLDRSLSVYDKKSCQSRDLYMCCSGRFEDEESLVCSICKECYHLHCVKPTITDTSSKTNYVCSYCCSVECGIVSENGVSSLKSGAKCIELNKLIELQHDAAGLCVGIEEVIILHQLVEKGRACNACLTEMSQFPLTYNCRELSIVAEKLSTALKAVEIAVVYDPQVNCKFELAIAINSWRASANKLLDGSRKPSIQQIQHHLKEALTINLPPEDYFRQTLAQIKQTGMQWAEKAKKVSVDSGALGLNKVFDLIIEGERLPVYFEKELKLLKNRSMLYCICRKPYDHQAMIACDNCDEWYHFDCIKLCSTPKMYTCPACQLQTNEDFSSSPPMTWERLTLAKCKDTQTPSPGRTESKKKWQKSKSGICRMTEVITEDSNVLRRSSGIELLIWRNRKPFRRAARKREKSFTINSAAIPNLVATSFNQLQIRRSASLTSSTNKSAF